MLFLSPKIKSVTFAEYKETENLMENESMRKIFEETWKKTYVGKKYLKRRKVVIKGCCFVSMVLIAYPIVSSLGLTNAFAGVNEVVELNNKYPRIISKLKNGINFYQDTIGILGIAEDKTLFMDIIKAHLNNVEITYIVKAAKGLNFQELIDLVLSL